MLVLSRKQSQKIKLGDSIVITVVRVSGDKVRLGIEAPADLLVLREELVPFDTDASKPHAAPAAAPAPLPAVAQTAHSNVANSPIARSA